MIFVALMAVSLAFIVWYLVKDIRIGNSARRALSDYYGSRSGERDQTRQEEIGYAVARRMPLSLDAWEAHLRWAQRGGFYLGQSLGFVFFQCLVFAGTGAGLLIVNPAPVSLLVPVMAFAYPLVRVRAKGNTVRKKVVRTLPEAASLIAAELAAGSPPELALSRAATLPGPLSALLRDAMEDARQSGRALFSRKPLKGSLVETMRISGIPALHAFASQLDMVSSKGVAGAELMSEIARALGQEYRARLLSDVEKLDSRLTLTVTFFFFLPFVAILLYAALAPVLQIFTS